MRYSPCAADEQCTARNFNPAGSEHHCYCCKKQVHSLSCSKCFDESDRDTNEQIFSSFLGDSESLPSECNGVLEICIKCIESKRAEFETNTTEQPEQPIAFTTGLRASVEVVNMLKATPYFEDARELAKEEGWDEDDMDMYLRGPQATCCASKKEPVESHPPPDDVDGTDEFQDVKNSYAEKKERVETDVSRLFEACRVGEVSICSWYKDDPNHVIIIKLPVLNNIDVDARRCEFLHKIIPHYFATMLHNSVVGYYQCASYTLKQEWCMGYNASWSAFDVEYMGRELYLSVKDIFKAVYENIDFDKYNPVNRTSTDKLPLWEGGGDEPPKREHREGQDYIRMQGWIQTISSTDEIKNNIGHERYDDLVQNCSRNLIDCEKYLEEKEGLHALLPGLWLSWEALVCSPHLFRVFDFVLQEWEQSGETNNNEDSDEGNEEEVEPMEGDTNKKKKIKYTDTYSQLRKDNEEDDAFVAACKEYLHRDKGIMKMLKGELGGALKKWETRGNVYATLNLIRAVEFFLTHSDRFNRYDNDGIDVKVFTKRGLNEAGVEPMTWPSCQYMVRMPLPAVYSQSMLLKAGKGEQPITGMIAVVYIDNFRECPIEVHRILLDKHAYQYQ
ncbi:hypothetical protein QTG54_000274 [Skeletonema marinoi]|uniref:Uncharacterized protein n=1 Tax=Skeletonema marinoi TaxID=267567 RepID=A0AAD9DJT2_9STRA|nr:hypothetical protein QTG54_000274 [Skeletonema marinoi]